MEFEDNKNAMFCDPNAYIKNFNNNKKETRKVVFQEPYECLPSRYINNNFKKHECDCVNKKKECSCHDKPKEKSNQRCGPSFPFDFKSLLPLISNLGGNKTSGFGNILSMLMNNNSASGGLDISKLLTSFLSGNGNNLFKGMLNKQEKKGHEIKSTDIPIKNYTRVN